MAEENNTKGLFAKPNPKQSLISHKVGEGYEAPPLKYFKTDKGKQIAYRKHIGNTTDAPQILYVPGFFAGMDLSKTVVVEQYARVNGYTNVRYDPISIGKSTTDYMTLEFQDWLDSALAMVDNICDPNLPILLVSSSVGSWLSAHVALKRPSRIAGIIMCGPAFNCIIPGYWFNYSMLEPEIQKKVDEGTHHMKVKVKYGGMLPLRRDFAENTAALEFDLNEPLDLPCPVRIIHSIKDFDIPYENSMQLMQSITSDDVDIVLRKTGNHRLMTKSDCMLTLNVLDLMIKELFPNVKTKNNTRSRNNILQQSDTRELEALLLQSKL